MAALRERLLQADALRVCAPRDGTTAAQLLGRRQELGLTEQASRFAKEQEIQRPQRMFGVWTPGFD